MATIVEGSIIQNGPRKYDWDSWFDGNQWMLEQGVDFTGEAEVFRTYVYTAGRKRGLKLSTRSIERNGKRFLAIQAHVSTVQVQHP